MYNKIQEYPDLIKDINTGAVLCKGNESLNSAKTTKRRILASIEKDKTIEELSHRMYNIETMLSKILEKL